MAEQPKDPRTASGRLKAPSPDVLRNLPVKQRLPLQYAQKLEFLRENYKHIYLKFEEGEITADLTDVLAKTGFIPHPQPEQKIKVLIHNVIKWLDGGNLLILHFRPKFTEFNLINLLREIKLADPACTFEGLLPVFFGAISSSKQMEMFKHLGAFGIRYAFFLAPGAPIDHTLQEVMEELEKFNGLFQSQTSTGKISALDLGEDYEEEPAKVKNYKELVARGEAALAKGDFEEAIGFFSQAIEMGPDFGALMDRGDAYYKTRKFMPALADYREAARLARNSPAPYAKIGECCLALVPITMQAGDKAKAKQWFEDGMKHLRQAAGQVKKMEDDNLQTPENLPSIPFAPILMALAAADIRGLGLPAEEEEMAAFAKMALEKIRAREGMISDVSAATRIEEAVLMARYGQYREAEKIFREVIAEDTEHAGPAFNNFAVELRKNGQHGKAFEIYGELLRLDIPDRDIVVENMKSAGLRHAAALKEAGRADEAVDVYRALLAVHPQGREWILCDLANAYVAMREPAQAAFTLMEAIYINPKLMESPQFAPYKALAGLRDEMMKKLQESQAGKKTP
ncbi:MAG: hypothetical protein HZA03_00210 [Nitrospinae bacterium]|nr:hypothetical protein [Nitrospinota bacterium]